MLRMTIFAVICLICSTVMGAGEAASQREFTVKTSPDKVANWLKAHPNAVAEATHSIVISRNGDMTRVRRETVKGDYEFTMKETIKQNGHSYSYEGKLVQAHQGQMISQIITVELKPSGTGSSVSVYMFSKVGDRNVRNMDVRVGISKSMKGFENFMIDQFD